MKNKLAYIILNIAITVFTLVSCAEMQSVSNTAAVMRTEPEFVIRRPSAEQDALFTMERITDTHPTAEFYYSGYKSFEEFIAYADNPLCKPIIIRVSIVDEVAIIPETNQFPNYETVVNYRIEEIYYSPEGRNLEIGDMGTMINYRGMVDGKMWYFEGELPLMDCYEYYLIRYENDSEKGNAFTYTIPVADCFEQYEETMNYYGFNVKDVGTIFPNAYSRLKNYFEGCKTWLENEDNLQTLKNRLAEDDNDRYWKSIVDIERENLVSFSLADQVKPYDSIEDVVSFLGNPQNISGNEYFNSLTYHLSIDGSQSLSIRYDYVTNKIYSVLREYTPTVVCDRITAERIQVGMTYDEVVQIMGVPYMTICSEAINAPYMYYYLSDESRVTIYLDYSQDELIITSIVFD